MLNYFSHIKNHLGHCNWPRWRVIALGGKQWASVKKTDLSLSLHSLSIFLALSEQQPAKTQLSKNLAQKSRHTADIKDSSYPAAIRGHGSHPRDIYGKLASVYTSDERASVEWGAADSHDALWWISQLRAACMKTSHSRISSRFLRLWSWSRDDVTSRYDCCTAETSHGSSLVAITELSTAN